MKKRRVLIGAVFVVAALALACLYSTRHAAKGPLVYIVNMELSPEKSGSATRIDAAFQETCKCRTQIEHFERVTGPEIARLKPALVVLSGQGVPWEEYPQESLDRFGKVIRDTKIPLAGFCGGHQFIAMTFGGRVDRIKRLSEGQGYDGCLKQTGFVKVRIVRDDPVLGKAGSDLEVSENHYEEIKDMPAGFVVLATEPASPNQAIKHESRFIYGFQFHPERSDPEHPDGRTILTNLLQEAGRSRD